MGDVIVLEVEVQQMRKPGQFQSALDPASPQEHFVSRQGELQTTLDSIDSEEQSQVASSNAT